MSLKYENKNKVRIHQMAHNYYTKKYDNKL